MMQELVCTHITAFYGCLHFGVEYRSGIYTHSDEQMRIAKEVTDQVQKDHFTPKGKTITTEIVPAGTWYDAEVSVVFFFIM